MNKANEKRKRLFQKQTEHKGRKIAQDIRKIKSMKNVIYILKMLFSGNPVKVIFYVVYTIIRYVFNAVFWVNMPKVIFESIEQEKSFIHLFWVITIYCVLYIVFHVLTAYHEYYTRLTDPEFYGQINRKIMQKAIRISLHRFESPKFYDDYSRAVEEAEENAVKLLNIMAELIGSFAGMITVVIIVIQWDPVILSFALLPLINGYYVSKIKSNISVKQKNALVRNQREVEYSKRIFYEKEYAVDMRVFPVKNFFLDINKKNRESMVAKQIQFSKKHIMVSLWEHLVMNSIFPILCGIYTVYQILINGNLSIGIYVSLIVAVQNLCWQIEDLILYVGQVMVLGKSLEYLRDFLENEDEELVDNKISKPNLIETFQELELQNITYVYADNEKPCLNNINITIRKGEKIAFVGYNGAGKSTLVKIIMGLYEPEGKLLYNSQDINDFNRKSYRKKFATIFQDFQIYALSIASNVLMREIKTEDDEKKVISALEKAELYDKIADMENGIYTNLTQEFDEEGTLFSGGEYQKIALARVFANEEAEIIILDEPTSAMDPISEYNLYKKIMELADNKTIIIISHRLASARMADRIYMIENGSIIEEGNHNELMSKKGKYENMFNVQSQKYAELGILEELSL